MIMKTTFLTNEDKNILDKEITDRVTKSEHESDINSLNNRISNIITNSDETGNNSELIDIRTAYDGSVYTTAGDAVRGQIGKLSEEVDTLNQGGLNLNREFIGEQVNTWLDEHPEATTTVQDDSLDVEKLTDIAKLQVIKDYITPQMFGAVGDGVTDDTAAIQAAIDENNGATIVFPDGIYNISAPISMVNNYCCLELSSNAMIKAVAAMDNMLYFSRTAEMNKQYIKGGWWNGNGLAKNGIFVDYVANLDISDMVIQDCLEVHLYLDGGYEIFARNIRIDNKLAYSINPDVIGVKTAATDSPLNDIIVKNCTVGFDIRATTLCTHIHPWCNALDRIAYTVGVECNGSTYIDKSEIDSMAIGVRDNGWWTISITQTLFMFTVKDSDVTPIYIHNENRVIRCENCTFSNTYNGVNYLLSVKDANLMTLGCRFNDTPATESKYYNYSPVEFKTYQVTVADGTTKLSIPANTTKKFTVTAPGVGEFDFVVANDVYNQNRHTTFRVVPGKGVLYLFVRNHDSESVTISYERYNIIVFKRYVKALIFENLTEYTVD